MGTTLTQFSNLLLDRLSAYLHGVPNYMNPHAEQPAPKKKRRKRVEE